MTCWLLLSGGCDFQFLARTFLRANFSLLLRPAGPYASFKVVRGNLKSMIGNQDLLDLILLGYLLVVLLSVRRQIRRKLLLLHLSWTTTFNLIAQAAYQNRRGRPRRAWALPQRQLWIQDMLNVNFLQYTWKKHFRIEKATFDYICRLLRPNIERENTNLRRSFSVEERVGVSIWRLATGDTYRSCGNQFGMGKSTAISITADFINALCAKVGDFIKFPINTAEVSKKIDGFSEISHFPHVMGAIDGTHIEINAPKENHEDYFNRKRFYSVILQGVADANQSFMHISTGYPGSIHDSRVLRLSNLFDPAENSDILLNPRKQVQNINIRPLLVGDSAYPLKEWLMKPYPFSQNLGQAEKHFNKTLSKSRVVIEQAFGKLKGRWRCLKKGLEEDIDKVPSTITACCILHNICQSMADNYDQDTDSDNGDDDDDYHQHNQLCHSNGTRIREIIKADLFANR